MMDLREVLDRPAGLRYADWRLSKHHFLEFGFGTAT